jgi:Flp pilus assembly pilin Flp
VARLALVLSASTAAVLLVAGVGLWIIAGASGLLGNVEDFWTEATGQEAVSWNGPLLLVCFAAISVVLVIVGTVGSWLGAVLFNAASNLTGGLVVEAD